MRVSHHCAILPPCLISPMSPGVFDCLLKVLLSKRFHQDNPCIALNVDIVLK
jgi:hypothetical protein